MVAGPSIEQLRVFEAVLRHGSFGRAARALSRSQAAVTYAIKNLEAELGLTLFDRSGYRPVLTREGEQLREQAGRVLREFRTLQRRGRWLAGGAEEQLSIAISPLLPGSLLWPAVGRLLQRYPRLSLALARPLGRAALQLLDSGQAEVAILPQAVFDGGPDEGRDDAGEDDEAHEDEPIDLDKFETRSLYRVSLQPLVGPDHPLALNEGGALPRSALDPYPELRLGSLPGAVGLGRGQIRFTELATLLQALRLGIGWSLLPDWLLQPGEPGEGLISLQLESAEPIAPQLIMVRLRGGTGDAAAALWSELSS